MYRYIGNKTRLLSEITSLTNDLIGDSGIVIDLMAGTGVVSAEFRRLNYRVVASDVMTYSKMHLDVQLLLDGPPSFSKVPFLRGNPDERYKQLIDHLNNIKPIEGYFFQEYSPEGMPANGCPSRKYFTSDNAKRIDGIRVELNRMIEAGEISELEESLLKHMLIMSANEVANISGTYGYFLSKITDSANQPISLSPVHFFSGRTDHEVIQGFAEDIAASLSADLCYIDPPYIKRQYAANYHVLETLARGDEPEAQGKSGLRPWRDQYSNLCTKTKSKDSFQKIIEGINAPYFLISYSEDGLFPIAELAKFFEAFGKVEIREINYRRFRSNQSPLSKSISEYIIILHKN